MNTRPTKTPTATPTLEVIRIPLDADQAQILKPILDAHREANRFEGILCTLSRAYNPTAGMTVLELQVQTVDQRIANAIMKLVHR